MAQDGRSRVCALILAIALLSLVAGCDTRLDDLELILPDLDFIDQQREAAVEEIQTSLDIASNADRLVIEEHEDALDEYDRIKESLETVQEANDGIDGVISQIRAIGLDAEYQLWISKLEDANEGWHEYANNMEQARENGRTFSEWKIAVLNAALVQGDHDPFVEANTLDVYFDAENWPGMRSKAKEIKDDAKKLTDALQSTQDILESGHTTTVIKNADIMSRWADEIVEVATLFEVGNPNAALVAAQRAGTLYQSLVQEPQVQTPEEEEEEWVERNKTPFIADADEALQEGRDLWIESVNIYNAI